MSELKITQGAVILRGVVGSTVHGTAVENTDDRDEMAVVIEYPNFGITVGNPFESVFLRTQPEGARSGPGDLDLQVHSLRKFVRLALGGNPSILLMFFLPEYMVKTDVGDELVLLAPEFHSRKAVNAFLGYMKQQKERLAGKRGQKNVTRPELVEAYGYDTKYAGHIIRLGYQGLEYAESGRLTLPMHPEQARLVREVRLGKYPLEEVLELGDSLEKRIELAGLQAPPSPNVERVTSWMVDVYLEEWSK